MQCSATVMSGAIRSVRVSLTTSSMCASGEPRGRLWSAAAADAIAAMCGECVCGRELCGCGAGSEWARGEKAGWLRRRSAALLSGADADLLSRSSATRDAQFAACESTEYMSEGVGHAQPWSAFEWATAAAAAQRSHSTLPGGSAMQRARSACQRRLDTRVRVGSSTQTDTRTASGAASHTDDLSVQRAEPKNNSENGAKTKTDASQLQADPFSAIGRSDDEIKTTS